MGDWGFPQQAPFDIKRLCLQQHLRRRSGYFARIIRRLNHIWILFDLSRCRSNMFFCCRLGKDTLWTLTRVPNGAISDLISYLILFLNAHLDTQWGGSDAAAAFWTSMRAFNGRMCQMTTSPLCSPVRNLRMSSSFASASGSFFGSSSRKSMLFSSSRRIC